MQIARSRKTVMAYCDWDATSDINRLYHDTEWGVPLFDDRKQFEFLMMEVMQCGLNWNMMMVKRDIFRGCFDGFDPGKIALYEDADVNRIMETPGMIRSERKIRAVINNAVCFNEICRRYGSFSSYLWGMAGGSSIVYNKHPEGYIPVGNGLSDRICRDLKKRGFKYLGSITVYSHLQACGIINDHGADCPCFKKIQEIYPSVRKRRYKEKGVRYYGDKKKQV